MSLFFLSHFQQLPFVVMDCAVGSIRLLRLWESRRSCLSALSSFCLMLPFLFFSTRNFLESTSKSSLFLAFLAFCLLGLDCLNFLLLAVVSQLELSWPTSFLPAVMCSFLVGFVNYQSIAWWIYLDVWLLSCSMFLVLGVRTNLFFWVHVGAFCACLHGCSLCLIVFFLLGCFCWLCGSPFWFSVVVACT